jgi:hypothetical protein
MPAAILKRVGSRKCFDNYYRPLFNVADNDILIVDRRDKNN